MTQLYNFWYCACVSVFPWYIDWIYYRSAHGQKFAQTCDYVHGIADKIIRQRRRILVFSTPSFDFFAICSDFIRVRLGLLKGLDDDDDDVDDDLLDLAAKGWITTHTYTQSCSRSKGKVFFLSSNCWNIFLNRPHAILLVFTPHESQHLSCDDCL